MKLLKWYCEHHKCKAIKVMPYANSTCISALLGSRTDWYFNYIYCSIGLIDKYVLWHCKFYKTNGYDVLCPIHQGQKEKEIVNHKIHCYII